MAEIIVAVVFVGFLTGFVTVLCIGNYFRAKRAQERQRQRRLANILTSSHAAQAAFNDGHHHRLAGELSPQSEPSSASSGAAERAHPSSSDPERTRLLANTASGTQRRANAARSLMNFGEPGDDLLCLEEEDGGPHSRAPNLMSV